MPVLPVLLCQMLSRLLNSSHPEDLKAANKLIKEMVQEVNPFPYPTSSFYKSHLSVQHQLYHSLVCVLRRGLKYLRVLLSQQKH